jgi:hypothetical protein
MADEIEKPDEFQMPKDDEIKKRPGSADGARKGADRGSRARRERFRDGAVVRVGENRLMSEAPPQVMAKILHDTLVMERSSDHLVKTLKIPEPFSQIFREKVALYREAVILMRLIAEAEHRAKFADVQGAYEKILFGAHPIREGLEKLKGLKSAMMDLNKIVNTHEKARHLAWAREWFAEMGYDAENPITDFLLVTSWMEEFVVQLKRLRNVSTLCRERRLPRHAASDVRRRRSK